MPFFVYVQQAYICKVPDLSFGLAFAISEFGSQGESLGLDIQYKFSCSLKGLWNALRSSQLVLLQEMLGIHRFMSCQISLDG